MKLKVLQKKLSSFLMWNAQQEIRGTLEIFAISNKVAEYKEDWAHQLKSIHFQH
jgi:hypothetical protein